MDRPSFKRPGAPEDGAPSIKRAKLGTTSGLSFAERMMQKMGHKQGTGLGKQGHGMLTPIEVKLRPQGAGVGAVKEKTNQAKAEAKRAAEQRGEQYEDSSEEERRERRRKKDALKGRSSTTAYSKPKQRFRTVAEIEAEDGLQVPSVFKSLIDMTGSQPKLLTSTAGLLSVAQAPVRSREEIESEKLATQARRQLEAFAEVWRDLGERKKYTQMQEAQILENINTQEEDAKRLQDIEKVVQSIQTLDLSSLNSSSDMDQVVSNLDALVMKLEDLQSNFSNELQLLDLSEVAVAALQPLLKRYVNLWDPLSDPLTLVPYIARLTAVLDIKSTGQVSILKHDEEVTDSRKPKSFTAYEQLMFAVWLPKVRSAVINDWDPYHPDSLLLLVEGWKDILPQFVYDVVVNQLVVQKLTTAVNAWKPNAKSSRNMRHVNVEPHLWLFPWFGHLDEYHLDPKSSAGLLANVKRKFRSAFDTWSPSKNIVDDVKRWLELSFFQTELRRDMELRLLPALARYLSETFTIDPADQDITPIEEVLKWVSLFKTDKFARILLDAFFPKWFTILHLWLTSDGADFAEIGQWLSWWKGVFPASLNENPDIAATWDKGSVLMKQALDLGSVRAKTELKLPTLHQPSTQPRTQKAKSGHHQIANERIRATEETSFREIVEEICERESLLLIPLRKAHPENGLPLFRITASASGSGGVIVYMKGDILWVQNKKDRSKWEPIDIFEEGVLATLAEGR